MFHSVMLFGSLCIVESVKSANQIASDSSYSFKWVVVFFFSSAVRALIANNAVIPTFWVSVNRVVDCAVANAFVLHATDDFFKSIKVG